jgi:hypothetical protein
VIPAGVVIILLALASAASTFKGGTVTVAADPEEAATAAESVNLSEAPLSVFY